MSFQKFIEKHIEIASADNANVTWSGTNRLGEAMYSSGDVNALANCRNRMADYKAGALLLLPLLLKSIEQRDSVRMDDYGDHYDQELLKLLKEVKV